MSSLRLPFIVTGFALLFAVACATGELEQDNQNQHDPDVEFPDVGPVNATEEDTPDSGPEPDTDVDVEDDTGGSIDLCPGGCQGSETCTDDGCVDLCLREGHQCGSWVIDGHQVECGGCPSGFCDEGLCADICDEFYAQCGNVFWEGQSYECGSCQGGQTCRYNQCAADQGFVELTAGSSHTCGLRPNGQIRCWGNNNSGQLGNNQTAASPTPVAVFDMNSAATLASWNGHTCVARQDQAVRCWGANGSGRLGNLNTVDSNVPVSATGVTAAVDVTTGGAFSCARVQSGNLICWGDNEHGQLGNGESLSAPSTYDHAKSTVILQTMSPLDEVMDVALGSAHGCGLRRDNTAWCWGWNTSGQLGLGDTTSPRLFATQLTSLEPAHQISAGLNHACALTVGGDVYCWGRGNEGQLGQGAFSMSTSPVEAILPEPAVHIDAGRFHTCAAGISGAVYCWGENGSGQLGQGNFTGRLNAPTQVGGIDDAYIIAAGGSHTCALLRDGTARCWGENSSGQLGDDSYDNRATPVPVAP